MVKAIRALWAIGKVQAVETTGAVLGVVGAWQQWGPGVGKLVAGGLLLLKSFEMDLFGGGEEG